MAIIEVGGMEVTETQAGMVTRYAWNGIRTYKIPVHSYLGHATNMYFVLGREVTLIDVALDTEQAKIDLEDGFQTISRDFGEIIGIEDVTGIVISHGHADHWGMLSNPRFKGKRVYIHQEDTEFVKDFRGLRGKVRGRMAELVKEAGWSMSMDNLFSLDDILREPQDIELVEVDDGQKIIDGYEVYHVPGHSPGHICLKIGAVLFLGDHVLSETTPLQIPRSMREGCGVRQYINSLRKVGNLGDHMGLPAHEDTIYSVKTRTDEIEAFHFQRLLDVLDVCREEKNLFQITDEYYQIRPETINGKTLAELPRDQQILALEEIKAHVEYLIEDGHITITDKIDGVVMYRAT